MNKKTPYYHHIEQNSKYFGQESFSPTKIWIFLFFPVFYKYFGNSYDRKFYFSLLVTPKSIKMASKQRYIFHTMQKQGSFRIFLENGVFDAQHLKASIYSLFPRKLISPPLRDGPKYLSLK